MWDVKEPTHYSKRVEREVPSVVAVLSCQYSEGHKFISHRWLFCATLYKQSVYNIKFLHGVIMAWCTHVVVKISCRIILCITYQPHIVNKNSSWAKVKACEISLDGLEGLFYFLWYFIQDVQMDAWAFAPLWPRFSALVKSNLFILHSQLGTHCQKWLLFIGYSNLS